MNVFVRGLGDALAADHEVEMLTRARSPEEVGQVVALPSGALVRFLEAESERTLRKEELMAAVPAFQRSLAQLPRFDVLHAHYWLSGMATALVASDTGARFALTLHTNALVKNAHLAPGEQREPPEREAGERALVAAADAILCVTGAEQAALIAGYSADPERTVVVTPGVDTKLFRPDADDIFAAQYATGGGDSDHGTVSHADADSATALPPTSAHAPHANTPHAHGRSHGDLLNPPCTARFVVAGRVQPLKGQELAVRVAALVPGSRLRVVGAASGESGTCYLTQVRDLSAHLGIADRVIFTGARSREQLAAEFAAADIALVPSFSESFGLVALEAAACGTPVIAQGVGGLRESVIDGETGVLVDNRNPACWAVAAYRLLNRTVKQKENGLRASLAHAARHNWVATARATLAAYGTPRIQASTAFDPAKPVEATIGNSSALIAPM